MPASGKSNLSAVEGASAETRSRDHVASLERGLAVLETLARHPAGLTLSEAARMTGLTRAGARRLLLTLVSSGYAAQSGRRFLLTPHLISVARNWLGGATLWRFAEPFMRQVSETLDESCSAAVLTGEDVVYVARIPGRRILSVGLAVGTRLPAWCTALGRVLLSQLAPDDMGRFLAEARIEARTPYSKTDRRQLAAEIAATGRKGYAVVDQELEIGLRSIAVPIRDRSGAIVAAMNVSCQAAGLCVAETERRMLPVLLPAAAAIEGYFALS